jgi:GT2 family glycosyltransferase
VPAPTDRSALCVVPTYLRTPEDLDVVLRCLVGLTSTARNAEVLVVDDGSPETQLVELLGGACVELGIELHRKAVNSGFSKTVNVGMRRALETGRDAVLVNADMEFPDPNWLDALRGRTDTEGRPAAVVGARLLYPSGLLQHAGVYFSMLTQQFHHRFQYAPPNLPEALTPCLCPVTGALQLIRYDTLECLGLYDEGYSMQYEDVDYCLKVFEAGLECVYEPAAVAVHHESLFRKRQTPTLRRWHMDSSKRLRERWGHADFAQFVPDPL